MSLRIRQVVLAAQDLASATRQAQDALDLQVIFRDPEVAKFGLENVLMAVGDQFLEIISPTRADMAASRHLDRHGDSAYMLILQTDDLTRERARISELGVRIIWESEHADMRAIHLHPKDIGAAIVSLDEATPPESWRWAGPKWRLQHGSAAQIVDATIATEDPSALAHRWSSVLGLGPARVVGGIHCLAIDKGALKFVSAIHGTQRIVEFGLRGSASALPTTICGTRFVPRD